VPGWDNIFVLGCFARHVTIYSQQVRALNLIWTLDHDYGGLKQKRVAIIGAGGAGLTAAAAALLSGSHVTLLEQQSGPLMLQKGNWKRWLHPHIYDWPFTNEPDRDARLPVLNWTASNSEEVANQIGNSWAAIAKSFEGFLDLQTSVANVEVSYEPTRGPTVSWNSAGPRHFEVVILAVGFGLEGGSVCRSYWAPDDLDVGFGPHQKCLVSGYGDGGLIDLARLCIRDFRQDELVNLVANSAATPSVIARIKDIESQASVHDDRWLTREYRTLNLKDLQDHLQAKRRQDRTVYLAGKTPWPYSNRSSALNRFIVSQLERISAFTPLTCGPWSNFEPSELGGRVTWPDGRVEQYDRVVVRHGPTPVLDPKIATLCDPLRRKWAGLRPDQDPTRVPRWPEGHWEDRWRIIEQSWQGAQRSQCAATSMIEMVSKTMANPKYKEDLARLDQHWKLEAAIGKQTIIIVIGATVVCELLDRPVGEHLRDLIDEQGASKTPYHRAVVVTDCVWEREATVNGNPLLSIGGPDANNVTKRLLNERERHPEHTTWEMGEGSLGYFQKLRKHCPQVALHGDSAARTRRAVEVYIDKPDGLKAFLKMCWSDQ
jgi:hypothetical protein